MFTKGKPRTTTVLSEPKSNLKTGVPSIISADTKIVGSVESTGDIQVDGVIEGDVTSQTLTVSDIATVHGSISADTVRVAGTVRGGIRAKSATLTRTAKVEGDIVHQALAIEAGASFEGQCKRMNGEGVEKLKIALLTDANATGRRESVAGNAARID